MVKLSTKILIAYRTVHTCNCNVQLHVKTRFPSKMFLTKMIMPGEKLGGNRNAGNDKEQVHNESIKHHNLQRIISKLLSIAIIQHKRIKRISGYCKK